MGKLLDDPTRAKKHIKIVKLPRTKVATKISMLRNAVKITLKDRKLFGKTTIKTVSLGSGNSPIESFYTPMINIVTIKFIKISDLSTLGKKRL